VQGETTMHLTTTAATSRSSSFASSSNSRSEGEEITMDQNSTRDLESGVIGNHAEQQHSNEEEPTSLDAMEQGSGSTSLAATETVACSRTDFQTPPPPPQQQQNNNNKTQEPEETAVKESHASSLVDLGIPMMSDHPSGYLVLRPGNYHARHRPPPPPPKNTTTIPRMVSSDCAICLDEYQVNDIVVWSCNKDCQHAFHQECILEWLNKIPDGGTPCPCCRQEFTDWETQRQLRKIKWAADKAFDVQALRFT
jgi:Ring finger domain